MNVEQPYAARLRYLHADAVDDAVVNYDGLDVRGPADEKLGDLDGFIVDAEAGRVHYIVIDTAGWFRTKQLLLPIGHATLDTGRRALRVDVAKDALNRYPEFDGRRFREFSDEDLRAFEARTVEACCPDDASMTGSGTSSGAGDWPYESRRHYNQPAWWKNESYSRERLGPVDPRDRASRAATPAVTGTTAATRPGTIGREERVERERIVARDDDAPRRDAGEVSPHFGGRAQPGDVLGIETGGEVTSVGDSPEDENERRRDAERDAAKDREKG